MYSLSMRGTAPHGRGCGLVHSSNTIVLDVLDAWFAPSPNAVEAFTSDAVSLRSSPPVDAAELVQTIGDVRGIPHQSIHLGAGSSELIHRVLPPLAKNGTTLLLDPTYSEYAFVLASHGLPFTRYALSAKRRFYIDLDLLIREAQNAKLVVLVNPNNPTGKYLTKPEVLHLYHSLPNDCALWIDEAYVDYCPELASVEQEVPYHENLYVLKSLSKSYALSGVRAAYLVAPSPHVGRTPPWIVGTSAMKAAIAALKDQSYYTPLWQENLRRVTKLENDLQELGLETVSGVINALLVKCPHPGWVNDLNSQNLIVRTSEGMGETLGDSYIRISLPPESLWKEVVERLVRTLLPSHAS